MSPIKFIAVSDEEAELILSSASRARNSAVPILLEFLQCGLKAARLPREDVPTNMTAQRCVQGIRSYAKKHNTSILATMRGGDIYLFRLEDKPKPPPEPTDHLGLDDDAWQRLTRGVTTDATASES